LLVAVDMMPGYGKWLLEIFFQNIEAHSFPTDYTGF